MKLAKDHTRMRVCLTLGMAFVVLVLGISHYLRGAKPAAPALRMEGKINIVTIEKSNFLRVWEKESSGDAFKAVWSPAGEHSHISVHLGDATNYEKKEIIASAYYTLRKDSTGYGHRSYFVVYEEGSTGSPSYTSASIYSTARTSVMKALSANTTSGLAGNEVVLMSDIALAVFWFNGTSFEKRAETAVPDGQIFYDFCVADVDGDGEGEIIVNVRNGGEVWIYDVVHSDGRFSLNKSSVLAPAESGLGDLYYTKVRAADINGDGLPDIMAFSHKSVNGQLQSYFNSWIKTETGEYDAFSSQIGIPGPFFRFDAKDLGSDGKAEVVIGERSDTNIHVWEWNDGGYWDVVLSYSLDREIWGLTISPLGGATPKIIVSGFLPANNVKQNFYLETIEFSQSVWNSRWKFEGVYPQVYTHAND